MGTSSSRGQASVPMSRISDELLAPPPTPAAQLFSEKVKLANRCVMEDVLDVVADDVGGGGGGGVNLGLEEGDPGREMMEVRLRHP